jgi:enamine deaminase RidA (YjgF/YER057c/UK114 family)
VSAPLIRVPAPSPYAELLAYSRAVAVGDSAWVSACGPIDAAGALVGQGDPELQAGQCLANVRLSLEAAGFGLEDVVRTRIYLLDYADVEAVGRTHARIFRDIRPACAVLAVAAFFLPGMRVYIEAEACRVARASSQMQGRPAPSR